MIDVCICSRVNSKDDLLMLVTIDSIRSKYNVKGVFFEYDESNYDVGNELLTYSLMWWNTHICLSECLMNTNTRAYNSCITAHRFKQNQV